MHVMGEVCRDLRLAEFSEDQRVVGDEEPSCRHIDSLAALRESDKRHYREQ